MHELPLIEVAKLRAHELEFRELWQVRSYVIMPDHIHLLVALGSEYSLMQAVRLFRGGLSPALRKNGLSWERGYFDHRIRRGEDRLPVLRYIFLNPYRAGLVSLEQQWPGYYCAGEDWTWFRSLTNDTAPYPEWLL